jgi:hypothetical protein
MTRGIKPIIPDIIKLISKPLIPSRSIPARLNGCASYNID